MSKYLVIDLETGIKEVHGRKGNPWFNDIVAAGFKTNKKEAFTAYGLLQLIECLKYINEFDILIGHNIKFDLLYLWHRDELQDWLLAGGRIYDTQLAEYILSGQKHKYPALRDVAVNKYGCSTREKKMEAYWEQGIDTKDIPKELVLEDVTNDVIDTEAIMLQQVKLIKQEGMYELVMEQMEGLLATVEMEYNGIYIDKPVFYTNKEIVKEQLITINNQLENIANKYWI